MNTIARQRLMNHRLVGKGFEKPEDVVAWLGAVQAQEYGFAKWALGLRMENATDADLERAFIEGRILRTHVMRPTWHFVSASDIGWILMLTAPRVHAVNGFMYRKLELDESLLKRGNDILAKALQGGKQLTRAELATVLEQAGIPAEGMRLGYIVHHAELDAVVCSGPRRGKQFTYMLLDERAPDAKILDRDAALAELTRRYFTSHGPATVKDFGWWSGLTQADIKSGLAMLKDQIVEEIIDGVQYWRAAETPSQHNMPSSEHLLPIYDEYTLAYKDYSPIINPAQAEKLKDEGFTAVFSSAFVLDGQIVGMWRRTFEKKSVNIELVPLRPLDVSEKEAFSRAAGRFGDFLGMSVVSEIET